MNLINRKVLVLLLVAALSFFVFLPPEQSGIGGAKRIATSETVPCSVTANGEDVKISSRLLELFFGKEKEDTKTLLIPGGVIFGARIKQSYVSVQNPGDSHDIKPGDKILSVNGKRVSSVNEVKEALKDVSKEAVSLVCERDGKAMTVKITPKLTDGEYRLGLVLRDGAAGIGTITYIDPNTREFGGLGHGICDTDTGEVIDFTEGDVTGVILSGVKKGEEGKPGELSGLLTDKVCGTLYSNTECGVFGTMDTMPDTLDMTPVEVAHRDEVGAGEATILSTVKLGAAREFKIEISEINKASTGTKSFKIKVTDPALIAITGGVVRGMSGSPIIQDGKLVGAVTHVLINDPTMGYGIFIENMLNASESARNELPKSA